MKIMAIILLLLTLAAAGALWANGQAITDEELLTSCLVLEAGGEGKAGMHAVLSVIVNRHRKTGEGFRAIILKRKQFSCFNTGMLPKKVRIAKLSPSWHYANRITRSALYQTPTWQDSSGGAFCYYNPSISAPSWADEMTETKVIGHHRFMK